MRELRSLWSRVGVEVGQALQVRRGQKLVRQGSRGLQQPWMLGSGTSSTPLRVSLSGCHFLHVGVCIALADDCVGMCVCVRGGGGWGSCWLCQRAVEASCAVLTCVRSGSYPVCVRVGVRDSLLVSFWGGCWLHRGGAEGSIRVAHLSYPPPTPHAHLPRPFCFACCA